MSPAPTQSGGQQQRRRRPRTRYGIQLQEKQDLKNMFGIREEQLKRYFRDAQSAKGETGPNIIALLEGRLDNAIYRAGFAQTRAQARQMASHRLLEVNGRPVNIPSYALRPGDVVSVREGKRKLSYFSNFDKRMQNVRPPSWLTIDPDNFSFTIGSFPSSEEANLGVDIRAVVEFFAR